MPSPSDASTDVSLTPIDGDQRIHALDILRGLALFGMILVHFHQKMRVEAPGIEDLIGWGVYILVEQKAWGIFAFLFGVGFAVLLRRLEARRAPVAVIYIRRLAALAAFGIVAEVGFGFHILFAYASWGVILLVVRRWSSPVLLATAALAAAARPLLGVMDALWTWTTGGHLAPSAPSSQAIARAVDVAAAGGSYLALLQARWTLFLAATPGNWANLLPDTNLTLFILGLLAVRHGVIDQPRAHLRLIRGWMLFGGLSWLASWTVLRQLPTMPVGGLDWPLAQGVGLLQDQWLCLTYIGIVLLLLAHRPWWTARLAPVGQAGRMALTNYLLQAAILDLLASGYGVALRIRPSRYVVAALALFGVELALSRAWLARFRFGPLEWIWRMATYARRQPLRQQRGFAGTPPPTLPSAPPAAPT